MELFGLNVLCIVCVIAFTLAAHICTNIVYGRAILLFLHTIATNKIIYARSKLTLTLEQNEYLLVFVNRLYCYIRVNLKLKMKWDIHFHWLQLKHTLT